MKKFLALFFCFVFTTAVYADTSVKIKTNLPQGTFKKSRNGEIVQYENGKKTGVYKLKHGKYLRVK